MSIKKFCDILSTIVLVCYFGSAYGIAISSTEKNLTNIEKQRTVKLKNEILYNDGFVNKAKTEKRGIWEIGSNYGHSGGGPSGPTGPSYYGGFESSGFGGGYSPHSGTGHSGTGHSGTGSIDPGYYGDHQPGYGFPHKESFRPTNYGPNYGTNYEGGYEEEHHYHDHHQEHHQVHGGGLQGFGIGGLKSLALKKILIPLAGLAILGVAAAASHNPILLQLGVVNGRRRKRSALPPNMYPSNPRVRPRRKY